MIRNKNAFESWLPALFDGQYHWDFLKPAWKGTRCEPMDFDAVVEKNGKVLIFETKNPDAKDRPRTYNGIPEGQSITLTDQWKKGATIIHVQGKTQEEINAWAVYSGVEKEKICKVGQRPLDACDAYDVLFKARSWFCWASQITPPSREEWDRELWLWDYARKDNDRG